MCGGCCTPVHLRSVYFYGIITVHVEASSSAVNAVSLAELNARNERVCVCASLLEAARTAELVSVLCNHFRCN